MIPHIPDRPYNQTLRGFYGEFGAGGETQIFYLQTTLRPNELSKTTLISDIPGSETWPVRDLFQREVDTGRVTSSILPYFQDTDKIKFFNPLTLALLPIDETSNEIVRTVPFISNTVLEEHGHEWVVRELPTFYRYRYIKRQPEFAMTEWDDSRVRLVAVDGQHRLAALKRYLDDPESRGYHDFLEWRIPAVVLGVRHLSPDHGMSNFLEVVRSVFVYINTTARPPAPSRQILLSDESINAICTQELLQVAHENELDGSQSSLVPPLLFFDWRATEEEGERVGAPASVSSIEEVHEWFAHYLLQEDFSSEQAQRLGVEDGPLAQIFARKRLATREHEMIRNQFREHVLPGFLHLLTGFKPLHDYARALIDIQQRYEDAGDVGRHALHLMKFGTNRASPAIRDRVEVEHAQIVKETQNERAKIPELIRLDIGMRGVVSSFAELYDAAAGWDGLGWPWNQYAEWFVESLNEALDDHWYDGKDPAKTKLLRHVTFDHNDNVTNYRVHEAEGALGAFTSLLCCAYGAKRRVPAPDDWATIKDDLVDRLTQTLLRGYRKEVRPALRVEYPAGGRPLTEAVKREAQKRAQRQSKRLDDTLDSIANGGV